MLLVLGAGGQLARELARCGGDRALRCAGRDQIDLMTPGAVASAITALRPDAVINAAAYTSVDRAETEEMLAHRLNADAPSEAAVACADLGVPFVHVSTDYVFDGGKSTPYEVDDPIAPLGAYGRSKAAGEAGVRQSNARHAIVRTSWLYSVFGSNFVKTMLRLAQTHEEVTVVADQIGRPTHAGLLARACLGLADRLRDGEAAAEGTFHFAGAGDAVWADVADVTFAAATAYGAKAARVRRITTAEFPTPARRPANSRLATGKIEQLGLSVDPWQESVRACVAEILAS